VNRALGLIVALVLTACSHSGYKGPVAVHATLGLQSSFSTSGHDCQGTRLLSGYVAGRQLKMENQASRLVASPVLPQGVATRGVCEFHLTVTLPRGERSLWLPMSELGIRGCGSSRRGAVIFDRSAISAPAVNATLALPRTLATVPPGHCS